MSRLPTLARLAAELGLSLDAAALDRLDRYRALLLDWNQRLNLTAVRDPDEVEVRLLADSLLLLPWIQRHRDTLPPDRPLRIVDIGAGAGIPSLPLKLVDPTLDLTLIEATGKKVRFIETVISELGLTAAEAHHGRAEELGHDPALRGAFDVVVARAVARLPTLLEYCLPFLRPGGIGLFPKGQEAKEEAAEAKGALRTLHARLVAVEPSPLPELGGTTLIVVRQSGLIPKAYPRRSGLPLKRPL